MGFNSGFKGLIVSIRHLVYVTLYRCRIDTINSPDDGHMAARNMYRIKHACKRNVCQVGYLQRLKIDSCKISVLENVLTVGDVEGTICYFQNPRGRVLVILPNGKRYSFIRDGFAVVKRPVS